MSLCEHPEGKACESQAEWRHCFSLFTVDDTLVNAFLLLCWKHVNASARKALRADIGGFLEPLFLPDAPGAPIGSKQTVKNYWRQEAWLERQEVQSAT